MKLFHISVFLSFLQIEVSLVVYPLIQLEDLFSDVLSAIHFMNLTALSSLLTPETHEIISEKLERTPAKTLPVHTSFKFQAIDARNLSAVTFFVEHDGLTSNYSAVFSGDKYFMNLTYDLETLIEQSINIEMEKEARKLLRNVMNSILLKNQQTFNEFLTPTARFVTCGKTQETKNPAEVWLTIQQLPLQVIPVFHHNISVTMLRVLRARLLFNANIGDREVFYIATYSYNTLKWLLDKEFCSDNYPAFVNQQLLGESIAFEMFRGFSIASRMVSTQRYKDVVAETLTLIKCDDSIEQFSWPFAYFTHYLKFEQFYDVDFSDKTDFSLSSIEYNVISGSLSFIVTYKKIRNEMKVERINGQHRIVSIKNLNCLDYSNPDTDSFNNKQEHVIWMRVAEEMAERYVDALRSKNRTALKELLTDPYLCADGRYITHDRIENANIFPEQVNDLYVIHVEYDLWGVKMFQTRASQRDFGYEFQVFRGWNSKLMSEKFFRII